MADPRSVEVLEEFLEQLLSLREQFSGSARINVVSDSTPGAFGQTPGGTPFDPSLLDDEDAAPGTEVITPDRGGVPATVVFIKESAAERFRDARLQLLADLAVERLQEGGDINAPSVLFDGDPFTLEGSTVDETIKATNDLLEDVGAKGFSLALPVAAAAIGLLFLLSRDRRGSERNLIYSDVWYTYRFLS